MSDEAQTACAKCGAVVTTPEPATRLVTAGSAGVTGSTRSGPYCPACDDERCHLYALFHSTSEGFGFCGCGNPEDAYALVRDILALAPFFEREEGGSSANWAKVKALTGERAYYFTLYAIDRCEMLEHGGNVGGSWLSPKGTHYLGLMRKWEWDDLDGSGFPHHDDDDPLGGDCGPSCPHWEASTEEYRKDQVRREATEIRRAGDWQVLPPNVWVKLGGADASVLVKSKTWIKSRPGRLTDGKQ